MSSVVHKLSKEIGINEDELIAAGIRAYIKSELGKIESQLHVLYHRYRISSIKELEQAIENGTVVESDVFEDQTKIDYLEAEKAKLKRLLGAV